MSDEYLQARLQDIERHVRSLDGSVRVLASVDRPAIRQQIDRAFADPRYAIVYRGVQRGLKQDQIADELKRRGQPDANQPFVSKALSRLSEQGFVEKAPKGGRYVAVEGWSAFNLGRVLTGILRKAGIEDL